jgi:Na+/H+-dicarboxylate symporter
VSLTTRVLIGLIAGFALGLLAAQTGSPALAATVAFIEPVGTIWINAIRMTVIPLVVSSLIVGVASAPDTRTIGRVGGRAVLVFLAVLLGAASFAVLVAPPVLARIPITAETAGTLRAMAEEAGAQAVEGAASIPTFGQWLSDLVPVNPVDAAADGAMLPLIVFSVAFGLAAMRVPGEPGRALLQMLDGIRLASLQLVRWVLELAPIGVFALSAAIAARVGLSAAGALAGYVAFVSVAAVLFMAVVLYPLAALLGGVRLGEFARASIPAQAVAFSARSSLAALPAMIEGGARLGLPREITSFFLPLAASTFRAGAGIGMTVGVLFLARLYGVDLSSAQLFTIILTVALTSFSIPGIPGGSIVAMVPVLLAAGLPASGVGLLFAVDTIPDMFRTTTNVTGDMTAAAILGRRGRGQADRVDAELADLASERPAASVTEPDPAA